ncbi:protein DBF4 homolog A [Anguilla rostrata]|uniref:protein DBF4 homolog A n=1 Tax=Anguilla rostrata TaxID=7938 RepID=UPI0030D09E31
MKPRGIPRQSKTKFHESHADDGQCKETLESRLKPVTETNPLQNKPLIGKCFYLDLPFNKKTETLEKDIKILGGTVEKFFSKDIKYLVSNQREARYVQSLGRNSPIPSPADSGHSSPHPGSRRGSQKGSSQGPLDAVITSRGKSLVEKVIKEQERIQINRILSNALEWGIKILYIDDVISYIEKKKSVVTSLQQNNTSVPVVNKVAKTRTTEKPAFQKYDAGRISKPFVKVEDCSRHYRPIYLHIPHVPQLSLASVPPCSPFLTVESGKASPVKKLKEHRNRGQKAAASEACRPIRAKSKAQDARVKKRAGYCECCLVKYDNVRAHLSGEQHRAFSKSGEYHVVDRAISELSCRFSEIRQRLKRPKCSLSSVVYASGTRRKSVERRESCVKLDHSVEDRTGASAISTPAAESTTPCSAAGTAAFRPRKRSMVLRSSSQGSEAPDMSPKPQKPHRSVASKRVDDPECHPMGLDTQGIRSAPNPGKQSDAKSPETNQALTDGVLVNKRTCEDSRLLLNLDEDFQCSLPPKYPKTTSSQTDGSTTLANLTQEPLIECEQNPCPLRETSQGKAVDDAGHPPSRTESPPGRRLQRKVRNFRRWRKVGKTPKHTCKEEDPCSCTLQDLWKLFQSSEDMDGEFKGFAV